MDKPHSHFGSHNAKDHVKIVKDRHAVCKGEPHSTRHGFAYSTLKDVCRLAFFLGLLRILFLFSNTPQNQHLPLMLSMGLAFIFFHACMKAKNAWSYIELCHRSIDEEKNEIENNFECEKEELESIFSSKGFKEPLLKEIIEYISSDSKLTLDTMIREELNIDLETFPHPLAQSLSTILGGCLGLGIFLPLMLLKHPLLALSSSVLAVALLSFAKARIIANRAINETVWGAAIFITSLGVGYSLLKIFGA
ncbi:VIT1/CCC1 transporter family protein [Chlamydiifrater phoenicopteri]|uniref:VIT1/CCC1 transporter family protein n=1 Tax=Chlamydiifrater phoenicopteri TaxID=2681469 RepID=UPI001BCDFD13|nr:VIT1/CCC1 transporter family protein [Chlamydiifrater phoenicopteri]